MSATPDYIASLKQDGYVIIEGLLPPRDIERLHRQTANILQDSPFGRNEFEGRRTKRLYALLAKISDMSLLVEHPAVLGIVDALLPRNCLLSSAQAIEIHPGESAQTWHRDDTVDALPMPRQHFGVSAMWALSDFTAENGATELIAGSHQWTAAHKLTDEPTYVAEMAAGSVLIFLATTLHQGGANNGQTQRLGISPQYCVPWMRQSENMVLAVPPERARTYSERIQSLLGYEVIAPGFAGHVDGRHPKHLLR